MSDSGEDQYENDYLKPLIKKRASVKAKLTYFDKYLKAFDDVQDTKLERSKKIELDQRINNVELLLNQFDVIQNEIECNDEVTDEHFRDREDFENRFYAIVAKAKMLSEKFENKGNDEQSHVSHHPSSSSSFDGVKLPEIKLPKFDGTYNTWMEFRDIFESLIHQNSQISNIQKFHYLRASLIGQAPLVIQSLEFNSGNYIVAWNTLCDRFNNKHLLIQNHLKSIVTIENIGSACASKIRHLYENLFKHLSSLKQLGEPTDSWGTLLIFIMSNKLDSSTAHEWEKQKTKYDIITLDIFKDFLKKRANILETIEMQSDHIYDKRSDAKTDIRKNYNKNTDNKSRGFLGCTDDNNAKSDQIRGKYNCFNCKQSHSLFYCPEFLKLGIKERISKARDLKLCSNCLKRYHTPRECKWSGCKICGAKHNTILHEATNTPSSSSQSSTSRENNSASIVTNVSNCTLATSHHAILSTVKVNVYNTLEQRYTVARALLDCGSQSSFISTDLCNKLNLAKTKFKLAVSGIGEKTSFSNYKCEIKMQSTVNTSYAVNLSCFVLDKITNDLPESLIDLQNLNIPTDVRLADPDFYIPQSIDILIGADVFWQILSVGRINLGIPNPILQNTRFGWVVAGCLEVPSGKTNCYLSVDSNSSIQTQLTKFWEVEEVETDNPWSLEEQACEKHFLNNLKINDDGRYVVSLPFKIPPEKLGESRDVAIKRFLALERKLLSNKTLYDMYADFLSTYERLGHMTEVNDTNNELPEYYMPHHGVIKESSTSTKLRVVFNASSPTSTGLSLNDLQMTGPTIQHDLLSIILRFRVRAIALSGDIKMMYRQVLVNPEHSKLQKIIWRPNPNETLKTYELNTVTYGTTAASFLAIRCLHQVANECEAEVPDVARIIREDMYVDDLLTCVDTPQEAALICKNISEILLKRGFDLRKWKSNDENSIRGLSCENASESFEFSISKDHEIDKTLGLAWRHQTDNLTYKIRPKIDIHTDAITKRLILSKIATVFDPLGLVSPCIVIAKVLLQKLWAQNIDWDQRVPDEISIAWNKWYSQLHELNSLNIPRRIVCDIPIYVSLHGFADASESSYGACVYVISRNASGVHKSNLLCAKSKVAPVKSLSTPRLELCAALVLTQLIAKVIKSLNITFEDVFCWTDSTIVLGWLRTPPNTLKPFVGNRVSEIQKVTETFHWKHVPTQDNPADIVSRGLSPYQLKASTLWFHGPVWLTEDQSEWPQTPIYKADMSECKKTCLVSTSTRNRFSFENFSDFNRTKRIFAYVLRFLKNCKLKPEARQMSYLTVDELTEGFNFIIKLVQQESFPDDYTALQNKRQLHSRSNILSLHPFMDTQGILRVGGRLTHSDYPYSKKYPILLSPKHHITKIIFQQQHEKLLHAGPQMLLSSLRDTFWPISGRNLARITVQKCVKCARYRARTFQPIMGDLPEGRVRPSTPFSIVGVDYAGPLTMKDKRGRGCKPIKCWIALFICFSTRAIHLEIVLSLSSDDFLQSFNRFISRRGRPNEVFSDNGTNFVKANRELKEFGTFLQNNQDIICSSVANQGIKWHFIPTNSPHFGGIWEAGVKSLKYHLKRILGNNIIFFFDFQTLLIRIEAILNSRPITPLSSNPDDLTCLSPSHFLIGKPIISAPEPSCIDLPDNRLNNYQLLSKLYEHFWRRWSREYISELQQRCKWKTTKGNLSEGQLVLVKDDNLPPTKWRLGRVIEFIRGKDNIPRVALVRTADGVLSRAVQRLCILPVASPGCQGREHVAAKSDPVLVGS